ncbi:uroplakin-2 [Ascaphus truei]|uniref:uroplakin-2 n=1 Tax=Ascaphus truei TaxID=8439 RepID=UPI003F5AACFC
MQDLGIVTALLLISAAAAQFPVSLSSDPLSTSVLLSLPGCEYTGKVAELNIKNSANVIIQAPSFQVPQCRMKRDVVVVGDSLSGNLQMMNLGYQVTNLMPNSNYTAYYVVIDTSNVTSKSLNFTTENVLSAPPEVFARSGGMVVITVLLSLAMFILIIGLICILAMGGRKK